jgi:hypothetical protein
LKKIFFLGNPGGKNPGSFQGKNLSTEEKKEASFVKLKPKFIFKSAFI